MGLLLCTMVFMKKLQQLTCTLLKQKKTSMLTLEGEERPRQKDLAVPQIRLSKVELLFEL